MTEKSRKILPLASVAPKVRPPPPPKEPSTIPPAGYELDPRDRAHFEQLLRAGTGRGSKRNQRNSAELRQWMPEDYFGNSCSRTALDRFIEEQYVAVPQGQNQRREEEERQETRNEEPLDEEEEIVDSGTLGRFVDPVIPPTSNPTQGKPRIVLDVPLYTPPPIPRTTGNNPTRLRRPHATRRAIIFQDIRDIPINHLDPPMGACFRCQLPPRKRMALLL